MLRSPARRQVTVLLQAQACSNNLAVRAASSLCKRRSAPRSVRGAEWRGQGAPHAAPRCAAAQPCAVDGHW
jgi:hypothetical protein